MKVVIVTGGFDPLHKGHIEYFKAARKLGDRLVIGVNSDEWLARKKGRPFMLLEDRLSILEQSNSVDKVITFDDSDGSAKDAIRVAMLHYPMPNTKFIFANGGDRTKENIPEMDIVDPNLEFVFGVGGENKMNSSSWILEEWKSPKTERQWGYYRVLHEQGKEIKLKELTVDPGKKLSMQRHQHRSELWFVSEGQAKVYTMYHGEVVLRGKYESTATISIAKDEWHQLANETDSPLKIIEIQYGDNCVEEDIERKN
jgi:cytidyltransferase-like protein